MDKETNKALLLAHLGKQQAAGAPLADLRQVLPSLPASTVQALLTELRKEGKVSLLGLRRWARWRLALNAASAKSEAADNKVQKFAL